MDNLIENEKTDRIMFYILAAYSFFMILSTGASSCLIVASILVVLWQKIIEKRIFVIDKELCKMLIIYFSLFILIALFSVNIKTCLKDVFGTAYRFIPLFLAMFYIKKLSQLKILMLLFIGAVFIDDIYACYQFLQNSVLLRNRPPGFNNHPNFLADFVLIGMLVCSFLYHKDYFSSWHKRFFAVTGALSFIVLLLTQTRGAWIAFFGIMVLFAILVPIQRRKILAVFGVVVLLFGMLAVCVPAFNTRLIKQSNMQFQSNSERTYMWRGAIEIFKDNPLTGIGQEQFREVFYKKYVPPQAKEFGHGHPHNNFLKYLSEGGIVGICAFLYLYASIFQRLWKEYKQDKNSWSYALMGILILAAMQLTGLTNTNLNMVPLMRTLWFILGLVFAGLKIERNEMIEN